MCVFWSMVWLSVCVALAQEDPYCGVRYDRLCQGKGPHVACQYPFKGAGPECENYTSIIFTNDLKQFILHYINRRRQKIASGHERVRGGVHLPKPEIMMLVQWDRELAYLAQRLADQCQFIHDDCRATVRYPYAGQTVGEVRWRRSAASLGSGARRTIGRVFDAWWGERRRVHAKQLISPFVLTAKGAIWGHFSQLAVWTLRAMGCGAVHHGVTRPRLLLVCDFSHTNMLGQRTLSPGPAAPCPPHTVRGVRPYPLLCGPPPNPVVVDNDGDDDNERDEEEYDEDDDELGEEEAESKPSVDFRASEESFPTRPWPDRPVRPIEHEPVNTDNDSVRQEQKTIDSHDSQEPINTDNDSVRQEQKTIDRDSQPIESQSKTEDVITQPLRKQYKIGYDPAKKRIPDNIYDVPNTDHETDPQNVAQERVVMDTDNQRARQYDRTTNTHNHYARQKDKISDSDKYVNQDIDSHFETHEEEDREQDGIINTDSQLPRNQHKTVDSDRRVQYIALPNPAQEKIRPVQDMRLALRDDFADYRPTYNPTAMQAADGPRPVEVAADINPPRETDNDFEEMDNMSNRPVKNDVKGRFVDTRSDGFRNENVRDIVRVTRPMEDDDAWRKTIATNEIMVSVKYRENLPSLFKQRLNDELNTRNQELEQNRLKPQSRSYNRQSNIDKDVHHVDNHRHSQSALKGEYKAYNGYTQNFHQNRRPTTISYERPQWGDEMKHVEMSAIAPLRQDKQTRPPQVTVVVYRPTSLFSVQTEAVLRQRWAQTRMRPRRPGAKALMKVSNLPYFVLRHSKKASLVLDKDDEEQLYHDTGFKISSNKRN